MNSKNAKSRRLVDQAYHGILKLVGDGEIRDGDNMTFSDLSDRLGMSRMPVTVALDRLQREGLVESIPRIGTRLRRIDAETIWGLVRWRVAMECEIAREACEWMTATEREKLIEAGQRTDRDLDRVAPKLGLLRAVTAGDELVERSPDRADGALVINPREVGSDVDDQFHLLLADLCRAPKLRQEMRTTVDVFSVKVAICETVSAAAAYALPPVPPPDHETLARAIAQGTPQEADQCMRDHIENGFFMYGFLQWYRTHAERGQPAPSGATHDVYA